MTAPHPALAALDAAIEKVDTTLYGAHRDVADELRAARDLVAAAVTDSGARTDGISESTCPHPDTWFSRTLCLEPCGSMHDHCTECGIVVGYCPHGPCTEPAPAAVGVDDTTTDAREDVVRAVLRSYGFRDDGKPLADLVDDAMRHLGGFTVVDRQHNEQTRVADEATGASWVPLAQIVAGALPRRDWHVATNVALALELAFDVRTAAPTSGVADTERDAGELRCRDCGQLVEITRESGIPQVADHQWPHDAEPIWCPGSGPASDAPQFDWQAAEEGYEPCARGQRCELQLVRPGKVQCDCDSPGTAAAIARAEAEAGEKRDLRETARVDFLAAQFVPHWAHLTEEARDGVRPGIAGFLRELDGVR